MVLAFEVGEAGHKIFFCCNVWVHKYVNSYVPSLLSIITLKSVTLIVHKLSVFNKFERPDSMCFLQNKELVIHGRGNTTTAQE